MAAALLFIGTAGYAQRVAFGFKAGVNLANLVTDLDDRGIDYKWKTGFHIGAGINWEVSDNFSINPDLLYSLKGTIQKVDLTYPTFISGVGTASLNDQSESDVSLSYVELPVWFRYKFENGFYANAGFYLAGRVGYYTTTERRTTQTVPGQTPVTKTESSNSSDDDDWAFMDFGLKFGAGFKTEFGFDISAHYDMGLVNLDVDPAEDFYFQNRVIGVTLAYWLGQ
jgi:hypothetical protein